MINVNKVNELITKNAILLEVDDYNIFRFYCGDFEIGKPFISPLMRDNKPSFSIFVNKENGELFFNDFRIGKGDFVKFIQLKYGLSYFEALSKVACDFNLNRNFICKKIKTSESKAKSFSLTDKQEALSKVSKFRLGKKSRKWKVRDHRFWKKYGITYPTLLKYNVQPIEYIFMNDQIIKADDHAYCFIESKDGVETYKIYQPYNTKYKWINSHNDSVWQGWTQLPEKGKELILTKSLKDVMSIVETTDIPAISLQTEGIKPKMKIFDQLKDRFEDIYILYDNDFNSEVNWGRQFSDKLSKFIDIPNIEIPDKYKSKDYSDLVKNHGIEKAKKELEVLIMMANAPF